MTRLISPTSGQLPFHTTTPWLLLPGKVSSGIRSQLTSGENWELRQQLNSEYRDRRADAIKRVIANHTIGKDCSGLFPDVVKNMVSLRARLSS